MKKIIIATKNEHKAAEFRKILSGYEVITQKQAGINIDVDETGETFEENALLKARSIAKISGEIVIADDSGLEVFCLDNRPGVYSARYGGEELDYPSKINLLHSEMKNTGSDDKGARFVAAIALVYPDGEEFVFRGECYGFIADKAAGENGFGYDPVFYIPEYKKTFGELPEEIKNKISHRAKASKKLKEYMENRADAK